MPASQETPNRSAAPAEGAAGMPVRALLLGERLDLRAFGREAARDPAPLLVDIPEGGKAVLFRYGAAVLFGTAPETADRFAVSLAAQTSGAFAVAERDEVLIAIDPRAEQPIDAAGT